jgi:hypothetical protein
MSTPAKVPLYGPMPIAINFEIFVALIIIIGQRIEGQIEGVHVPQLSSVNPFGSGHPAVAHQFVELAGGNADVHRGFVSREAAAG